MQISCSIDLRSNVIVLVNLCLHTDGKLIRVSTGFSKDTKSRILSGTLFGRFVVSSALASKSMVVSKTYKQ